MKMAVKRPRGRPRLRLKDTVGVEPWSVAEEWATELEKVEMGRYLQDPLPRIGMRWRKVRSDLVCQFTARHLNIIPLLSFL